MSRLHLRAMLPLLAFSIAGASPALAQRVSLAPTVGVYIPTQELTKALAGQQFKQEVGIAVGGRLGIDFSRRLGFQATGSYVPSNLRFSFDQAQQTTDANLFFGSGKLAFFVIPPNRTLSLQINGGVAMVKRSGEAYAGLEHRTSVGGTVGALLALGLGPIPLQLGAEAYLYKQDLDGLTSVTGEAAGQKDIQLSIGFGLPMGGGRQGP